MARDSTVRILRAELIGTAAGDYVAAKACFKAVSLSIQSVVNDYYSHWLALHYQAGNHLAVRAWMDADRKWAAMPKADRPPGKRVPCPVKPMAAEMSRAIYHALRQSHPTLGTRPLVLAMNTEGARLTKTPATKSAYPRWMNILAGRGEHPSYSRPLPIPFDKANARLIPPEKDAKYEEWQLEVRLELVPGEKKLTIHRLKIKTGGRRLHGVRDALWKIAAGEWKWCGSHLVLSDGLWYAHLCYQLPAAEKLALDPAKRAYLSPATDRPMHLWIDGYPHWLRRTGRDIEHVRGQLVARRWSNSQAYEFASSARKGHGRKRAMAWREPLRRRWMDFQKTYNERLTADVMTRLRQAGIGTLVWYQPVGSRRDSRFLSWAGSGGRNDLRQWDWTQLGGLLARKCEENGIELEVRRCGKEGFQAKKRAESKNGKAVAADRVKATTV